MAAGGGLVKAFNAGANLRLVNESARDHDVESALEDVSISPGLSSAQYRRERDVLRARTWPKPPRGRTTQLRQPGGMGPPGAGLETCVQRCLSVCARAAPPTASVGQSPRTELSHDPVVSIKAVSFLVKLKALPMLNLQVRGQSRAKSGNPE